MSGHFELKPISALTEKVTSGGTPSRANPAYYGSGAGTHPWIKSKELLDAAIWDTEEKITEEGLRNSSAKYIPEDSVLVAMYGANVGQLGMLRMPATVNQAICALIPNRQVVDARYLFYALLHERPRLVVKAKGAAQQNLNAGTIREFEVPAPAMPVQEKIADILSAYDDLIEVNTRRIGILEELARRLFDEWFVKLRFADHALQGSTPLPWPEKPLGELASITMGLSPRGDTYNENGDGTPLVNGPVEFGDRFTRQIKWTTSPTKLCREGDLVVCVRGSTTGKYVKSDGTYCLGRGVCAIHSDFQNFVDLLFANELPTLLAQTSGSTFPSWTGPQLKLHPVISPPSNVLKQFEALVTPMSSAVLIFSRQIAVAKRSRNLLLPRLISGEIDLEQAARDMAKTFRRVAAA